jgi:hypothetical protein
MVFNTKVSNNIFIHVFKYNKKCKTCPIEINVNSKFLFYFNKF